MAEREEDLKSLLMKLKEKSDKAGLKLNIQILRPWHPVPSRRGDFIFFCSWITADSDCSQEIKRCLLLGGKTITNLDSVLKSRDITLLANVRLVKAMVFPVVMYRCESWTIKKAEHWRMDTSDCDAEEDSESPLDCKIKLVNPKGNQPWIFIGRTDAPILWPPDVKSQLTGKDPDAGKYWGQEENGVTEDEMLASKTQWMWIWAKLRR